MVFCYRSSKITLKHPLAQEIIIWENRGIRNASAFYWSLSSKTCLPPVIPPQQNSILTRFLFSLISKVHLFFLLPSLYLSSWPHHFLLPQGLYESSPIHSLVSSTSPFLLTHFLQLEICFQVSSILKGLYFDSWYPSSFHTLSLSPKRLHRVVHTYYFYFLSSH